MFGTLLLITKSDSVMGGLSPFQTALGYPNDSENENSNLIDLRDSQLDYKLGLNYQL